MWTRRNPVHAALALTVVLAVLASIVGIFLWREARGQILQHHLLVEKMQLARQTAHYAGWSEQAWSCAKEAAKIQATVKPIELRNQVAALLLGLDAHRVNPWTNPSSLGPPAFAKAGVQLRCNTNRLAFFLPGVVNSQTNREWRIPLQIGTNVVERNFPHVGYLKPDGSSVVALLRLTNSEAAMVVLQSNTVHVFGTMSAYPNSVTISSDGSLVAADEHNGKVSVWSVRDERRIVTIPIGRIQVGCLALNRANRVVESKNQSPDGVDRDWLLAAGDFGGNVRIWDLRTETTEAFCRGGQFFVAAVAFSPDGTILASGGTGPVKLWEVATGRELLELDSGFGIAGLDFSLDGKYLAVNWDGTDSLESAKVWELQLGRGIQTLRGLSAPISKLCLSADGNRLAALSHSWEVGLWDLPTGQLMRVIEVPKGLSADNAALAFSPTGDRLAFSTASQARLWDVQSGSELRSWEIAPGLVDELSFPDETHLLLFHWVDSVCQIHNLLGQDSGKPIAEIRDFDGLFVAKPTSDGKSFVVEGQRDRDRKNHRMIKSFDALTGKELWKKDSGKTFTWGAIVPDVTGKFVALHTNNSPIAALVELSSGSTVKTLPWMPSGIYPEANLYAVVSTPTIRGCSLFVDTQESPAITLGIECTVVGQTVRFDTTGNKLAWGSTDGTVTVCDLKEVRNRLVPLGLAW